ncbi:site-2 protease family protein [[Clostridium] colinum]|uniref:site-2 protease family protein n=1 Tax=[Clostridium] colinum TaxID=36835 RepID=UPI002025A228|nr:site-2 protease family protein [[Clostridium] colinum]
MDVILYYLAISLAVIVVMTITGFTKAYTSYKLGDIAIKNIGKVSLNPKKHFEILGFILFVFFNYGWTAPVDTSTMYYKNRKKGNILVNIMPLIVAIIFSFFSYTIFSFLSKKIGLSNSNFVLIFFNSLTLFFINFSVFNILPIYPLLGQKLFQHILPSNKAVMLTQYEKLFQILIIFLLLSGLLQKVLDILTFSILNFIAILSNLLLGII